MLHGVASYLFPTDNDAMNLSGKDPTKVPKEEAKRNSNKQWIPFTKKRCIKFFRQRHNKTSRQR